MTAVFFDACEADGCAMLLNTRCPFLLFRRRYAVDGYVWGLKSATVCRLGDVVGMVGEKKEWRRGVGGVRLVWVEDRWKAEDGDVVLRWLTKSDTSQFLLIFLDTPKITRVYTSYPSIPPTSESQPTTAPTWQPDLTNPDTSPDITST